MHDRAISETIGYILVFALITMTIGIVYASGFSGLYSAQEAEQLVNVERAFDVLNDNLRDIHQERAPSRATEIKLAGGSLTLAEAVEFTFKTDSTEPGFCNDTNPLSLSAHPIVYEDGESSVAYVGGAVIRTDGDNGVVIGEPAWLIQDDQSIVSFIGTVPEEQAASVGGRSTVLIVGRHHAKSIPCQIDPGTQVTANVTVKTTMARADAWEGYFEDQNYTVTRDSPTRVIAEFDTNQLVLSRTSVKIEVTT